MKLYTEDQLIELAKAAFTAGKNYNPFIFSEELKNITPIELPSDKDTAHLQWIYDRMSNVHGENENYDYMIKFKEIIEQLKKGDNK